MAITDQSGFDGQNFRVITQGEIIIPAESTAKDGPPVTHLPGERVWFFVSSDTDSGVPAAYVILPIKNVPSGPNEITPLAFLPFGPDVVDRVVKYTAVGVRITET